MICGAISATLMFTTVKLLGDRFDSVQIVFFRAVFGVAVAAPVLMRRGERGFRTGHLRLQVGTGVLGAIALIGFLLFSEIPDSWFWLGSAMIVAANIYIVRSRPKRKPDAAT